MVHKWPSLKIAFEVSTSNHVLVWNEDNKTIGPSLKRILFMNSYVSVDKMGSQSLIAGRICPVLDPAMVTTVNFFHGNELYMARRAKLAWLLLARH